MNIQKITQAQAFRGLNIDNVSTEDRELFVKKDFSALKKLGEKYDIRLVSCYTDMPDMAGIDIDVKPLKEELSFLQRIFPPRGTNVFKTGYITPNKANTPSIVDYVKEAISNLNIKLRR